jgi:hypothetical protein
MKLEGWTFRTVLPQASLISPYFAIGLTAMLYFITCFDAERLTTPFISTLRFGTGGGTLDGPL